MCPLSHVFGSGLQDLLLVNGFFLALSLLSRPAEPRWARVRKAEGVTGHAFFYTLRC